MLCVRISLSPTVRTLTFFSDLAGSYFIQINRLQADTVNFIYQIDVVQDLQSVSEVIFFDLQERKSLCCDFVLKLNNQL